MARMTASDMVTIARSSLGGETSETLTDATLLRFANRSMSELSARYKLPELITTTTITTAAGTATYTIAADLVYVLSVIDTTNLAELTKMSRYEYDQWTLGDTTNNRGNPSYWGMSGNTSATQKLVLYPVPDGTYTIQVAYYKKHTEIVLSPTPTSFEVNEAWDDVVLDMMIAKGWKYLGDIEKAQFYIESARDASTAAIKTSIYSSDYMYTMPSIVGTAVSDI